MSQSCTHTLSTSEDPAPFAAVLGRWVRLMPLCIPRASPTLLCVPGQVGSSPSVTTSLPSLSVQPKLLLRADHFFGPTRKGEALTEPYYAPGVYMPLVL